MAHGKLWVHAYTAHINAMHPRTCAQAPQAGEAVHFLVEEGSPVEYGQVIVELAPFFGGHIIGDSKYA